MLLLRIVCSVHYWLVVLTRGIINLGVATSCLSCRLLCWFALSFMQLGCFPGCTVVSRPFWAPPHSSLCSFPGSSPFQVLCLGLWSTFDFCVGWKNGFSFSFLWVDMLFFHYHLWTSLSVFPMCVLASMWKLRKLLQCEFVSVCSLACMSVPMPAPCCLLCLPLFWLVSVVWFKCRCYNTPRITFILRVLSAVWNPCGF